jgi:hypothetical protein
MIALAAVASLVVAGAAIAYFTSTGSGTGSATVGSTTPVTIVGTTSSALYPAGPAVPVSVVVTNPGAGSEQIGTVHPVSITPDSGHSACVVTLNATGAAYTMADVTINQDVAAGASSTAVNGSLQMNDTGIPQDACQGATLTINFTSN